MATKTQKPLVKVDETIKRKIAFYARCNRLIAVLEERKKTLATAIYDATGNAACIIVGETPSGDAKLATVSECTRESLDGKALKEAHPAIYAEYVRTTDYLMIRTS